MATEAQTIAGPGGSRAQLSYELGNAAAGAPSTIYITTDPDVNKLVLSIATSADGVTFAHGTPVDQTQAPAATCSLLYLDLTPLGLTTAELDALVCSAPGWNVKAYAADGQVCMTPDGQDVTLNASAPIAIEIDKLTLSNPPAGSTVQLSVTAYHVARVTIGDFGLPVSFVSALQNPPDGGADLHAAMALGVASAGVVASSATHPGVKNELRLLLSPGPQPRSVVAGPETTFTLGFVYADPEKDPNGYGALTDPASALRFDVARGPGAESWGLTDPTDQQNPTWLLSPPDGSEIIGSGTGPGAAVEIDVSGIVTTFQPGPTVLIVAYKKVPGFADGAYTVVIEKYGHVDISRFDVSPETSVLEDGKAAVTLTWRVANPVELLVGYRDVTGHSHLSLTIEGTTTWTLTAIGAQPGGTPNRDTRDVTAYVLPVIDSFVAEPTALASTDFDRQVLLSWNVNTNDEVRLLSSVGPADPTRYKPVDSVLKTLTAPQMLTLEPIGDPGDLVVRRSLVVSAFAPAAAVSSAVGADVTYVAIAPTTGYVVAASPGAGSITAYDTLVYQPAGSVSVGSSPAGLCFSPDGSLIYAVTSGDGNVSVVRPSLGSPPAPAYAMAVVSSLHVGGAPQQVATSPDGRFVYVTIDGGAGPGSLAVLRAGSGGTLTSVATLPVGAAPRGVATTASGAHVYVANSGDATVTIVGVGPGGTHSVVGLVEELPAQPTGVAVTLPTQAESRSGGILLVACAGAGEVVAIDTEHYDTAARGTLTVGAGPQQVALVPGGAYAVVSSQSAGELTLLGLGATPAACTVLGSPIAAPGATGVAASPDAGLVVAACPGQRSLAAVMLEQYVEQSQPVALPTGNIGQPTDVAVSADGAQVAIWHDSLVQISIGHPAKGVFAYDVASSTISQQLSGQSIVAFAYNPQAGAQSAFFTTQGYPYLNVVDTSSWNPIQSLDLSAQTDGHPIALAASLDGTTLFALAADAQSNYDVVAMSVAAGGKLTPVGTVRAIAAKEGLTALACAPDGSAAYVMAAATSSVAAVVRQPGGGYALGTAHAIGPAASAMAIAPDGSRLFVVSQPDVGNNRLTTVPLTAGGQASTVVLPPTGYTILGQLAVSPDGTKLLATDIVTAGIRVFDAASLRLVQTISWTANVRMPNGVAMAPDGSQIYTANINSNNLGIVQQVQPA